MTWKRWRALPQRTLKHLPDQVLRPCATEALASAAKYPDRHRRSKAARRSDRNWRH